ncbi:MAG: hypothetical protein FWF36_00740, partial [Propionibacteriaceae bacterium]|nr:hypothetical protein [Propionibacteriaceae bacterium]
LRLHSLGRTLRVVHIPLVLYHWREAAASTAKKLGYKAYAVDAGRRALAEYLRRVGVTAEIDDLPNQPSWFRIKPRWPASVAVVSAGEAARLGAALQAATSTACQPTWLCQPGGFEASAIPGDVAALVVLQKPFAPSSPDWLDDLVGALALPGATAVAPLLDNDDAGAVNPNVAAIRRLVELDEKAFLWPDTLVHDAPSVPSSVVAVKTGDVDLLDAGRISVPPERGRCVVWGPQRMVAQ